MLRNKAAIALALTLFLVLAGTGVGNAFWSAQVKTTSGVLAGTIGIEQSGFASLQMAYTATALVAAAPITVRNTGTITAPYALTLGAQAANSLASGVTVRTWVIGSAGECTASAIPSGATNSNWTNVPPMAGTLAPSQTTMYCVLTSITAAQQTSLAAMSTVATLSLVSTLGAWSASAPAATATQTVIDTAGPGTPGAPSASATTNTQTTLTWAACSDNVGVTGYEVYRGGVLLATVTSPTFTDTGLSAATAYTYAIKARDAAGNISAASGLTVVTTAATGDTTPPSMPGTPVASGTTGVQTTLTWAASTDSVGVTGYLVYRGGVLIATVTSTTFTDTGLSEGTTYGYSIKAKDAAGNLSLESAATSVITLALPTGTFKFKPLNGTDLCVNHFGNAPDSGVALITATCQGNSQPWNVVHILGGSYYKVAFPHTSKLFAWEVKGGSVDDGAVAQLGADTGAANQQWNILQLSTGRYSLVNRVSGKCLESPAALGTQLKQQTCNGALAQTFMLVP